MQCSYFDAGVCRSCTLMGQDYDAQVADKDARARALIPSALWLPPVASLDRDYRNKAKMVVGGTVDDPTLGILGDDGRGVDLEGCGILHPGLRAAFPAIRAFITRASLVPYDVPSRSGELKYVLLTEAATGDTAPPGAPTEAGALMLRFVMRSTEALARIRKHLPSLLDELPQLRVATLNLLPEHKAVTEGEREIELLGSALPMPVGDVTLTLRPQGFFQTNTEIAGALYREAADWASDLPLATAWDLYCGVGGFAFHLARALPELAVTGIESSVDAVHAARATAASLGLDRLSFQSDDAAAFVDAAPALPDLVVVNPPRRGIGTLAETLERRGPGCVVYSSCNVDSLARDLAAMPSYRVSRARVFDMFPQTTHFEVLTLLERR